MTPWTTKTAGIFDWAPKDITPLDPIGRSINKTRAVQFLQKILGAALGAGILGRAGVAAFRELSAKPHIPFTAVKPALPRAAEVATGKPDKADEKKRRKVAGARDDGLVAPFSWLRDVMKTPADSPSFFAGDFATDPAGVPITTTGLLMGTPIAAYLGWKGTDLLVDWLKRKRQDRRLQRIKSRYESLSGRFLRHKSASADIPADELFDKLAGGEKFPTVSQMLQGMVSAAAPGAWDAAGKLSGAYLALAAALALGSGYASYKLFGRSSRPRAARRTLLRYQRQRAPEYPQVTEDEV